jgi:hypothetical protein
MPSSQPRTSDGTTRSTWAEGVQVVRTVSQKTSAP